MMDGPPNRRAGNVLHVTMQPYAISQATNCFGRLELVCKSRFVELKENWLSGKTLFMWGLSLLLLSTPYGWAKGPSLEGVHYQPEGLVIQVSGGQSDPPKVETWPNIRDGVKTELLMIRLPDCTGQTEQLQQLGLQEITTHPEVKQFWVAPLNSAQKTSNKAVIGVQIVIEVETRPEAPEFTPDVLVQGDDQWIITLQGSPKARSQSPIQANARPQIAPEPESPEITRHSAKGNKGKSKTPVAETSALLASLNQARQKQAALAVQVVSLQQSLTESNTQKELLQNRLRGYENLLEEAGVDPRQTDESLVIQNLKNALVKVAQRLKTAETALAQANGSITSSTVNAHSIKTAQIVSKTSKTALKAEPAPDQSSPEVLEMLEAKEETLSVYKASPAVSTSPTKSTPQETAMIAQLKKAMTQNPLNRENYLRLADAYIAVQDWRNAESTLISLTRVEPGGAQGLYYLTLLYISRQDNNKALATLKQYEVRYPKDTSRIQQLKNAVMKSQLPHSQGSPGQRLTSMPTPH